MQFDRFGRQAEIPGDFLVRHTLCKEIEDVEFPLRHVLLQEPFAIAFAHGFREPLAAPGDGAHGIGDRFGVAVFDDISLGTEFYCAIDVFIGIACRKHDNLRVGNRRKDVLERGDAVDAVHADVEERDVGLDLGDECGGVFAVVLLAGELEVVIERNNDE